MEVFFFFKNGKDNTAAAIRKNLSQQHIVIHKHSASFICLSLAVTSLTKCECL